MQHLAPFCPSAIDVATVLSDVATVACPCSLSSLSAPSVSSVAFQGSCVVTGSSGSLFCFFNLRAPLSSALLFRTVPFFSMSMDRCVNGVAHVAVQAVVVVVVVGSPYRRHSCPVIAIASTRPLIGAPWLSSVCKVKMISPTL